jgi:hypothetical protein
MVSPDFLLIRFLLTALPLLTNSAFAQVFAQNETARQIPEAVGQYSLTRANSQDLPAVVSENGARRQEVIGGSVLLKGDGTYTWSTRYRYVEGGRVRDSESSGRGRYSQQGTGIIFLVEVGDDRFEGTLEGNTLTIQVDVPMVYRKVFAQVGNRVAPGAAEPSPRPTPGFTAPDPSGGEPPPAPPPNRITFTLSLAAGYLPGSVEELCDSSIFIVDADVQAILPPGQNLRYPPGVQLLQNRSFPLFRYLETDAILRVRQVLKGPESVRQVVISQKGGAVGPYTELPSQYNLMQRGERYILFLTDEPRPDLPDVDGIPRYALNGAWTGMFRIDESGVHLSPDTADGIRQQFDGGSSQDVITAIQRCSKPPVP